MKKFLFVTLFALVSMQSSIARGTDLPSETREKKIKELKANNDPLALPLTREECTPFNLHDEGLSLENSIHKQQYYSNCFSAGTGNYLTSFIRANNEYNKTINPSIHHMSVVYSLVGKSPAIRNLKFGVKFIDGKPRFEENYKKFRKQLFNANRSEEQTDWFNKISMNAFYIFIRGGSIQTLANVILRDKNIKICSQEQIEGRFDNNKKLFKNFTRDSRKVYQSFLLNFHKLLKRDQSSILQPLILPNNEILFLNTIEFERISTKLFRRMNSVYDTYNVPRNSRLSYEKFAKSLISINKTFGYFHPSNFYHHVLLGFCAEDKENPPFNLRDLRDGNYPGVKISHIPNLKQFDVKTKTIWDVRELVLSYFNRVTSKTVGMNISYAGYALLHGAHKLAWDLNEQNTYVNNNISGGHNSIISGRRWNEEKNHCEYQVTQSYLKSYNRWEKESESQDNVSGDGEFTWIKDTFLMRSINAFYIDIKTLNKL